MTGTESRKRIDELHQFHDLLLGHYSSSEAFLDALLDVGRKVLHMPQGIISRTHGEDYAIVACSPESDMLYPGAHFKMGRTFSARALEGGGTVSLVAEPDVEGDWAHPVYQSERLRSLISTPLFVRGRMAGTLDFCDTQERERDFSHHETEFTELLARAAGQVLERDALEQEREAARQRMEEHVSLFEGAFNNAAFGMALVSSRGRTLRVNAALCQMLGYSEEELLNASFTTISHPEDLATELEKIRLVLDGDRESYRMKKRFYHQNGSVVWVLLASSLVRDSQGEPLHFIAQVEDITSQIHAENALRVRQRQLETVNRRLEQLARTDALTGLANRRELLSRIELELKRSVRTGLPLSVLLVDLDHFKSYNDRFGHPEGDRALKVVANTLRDCCRDTDLVIRYGGEEFAALLPDTSMEDAGVLAERMRHAVEAIDSLQRDMSASIGIATSGDGHHRRHHDVDMEIAAVLEAADQALYRAKNAGRNQVRHAVGF